LIDAIQKLILLVDFFGIVVEAVFGASDVAFDEGADIELGLGMTLGVLHALDLCFHCGMLAVAVRLVGHVVQSVDSDCFLPAIRGVTLLLVVVLMILKEVKLGLPSQCIHWKEVPSGKQVAEADVVTLTTHRETSLDSRRALAAVVAVFGLGEGDAEQPNDLIHHFRMLTRVLFVRLDL